jgi:hypothetical protein
MEERCRDLPYSDGVRRNEEAMSDSLLRVEELNTIDRDGRLRREDPEKLLIRTEMLGCPALDQDDSQEFGLRADGHQHAGTRVGQKTKISYIFSLKEQDVPWVAVHHPAETLVRPSFLKSQQQDLVMSIRGSNHEGAVIGENEAPCIAIQEG